MKKLICLIMAAVLFHAIHSNVHAQEFTAAQFITSSDKTFSAYPGSETQMARTARVWVSFVVKKDGTVGAPMIEQINNERVSDYVMKWLDLRDYQPATVDGEAVDSWMRQRFMFNIGFNERSARVSTKLFNRYYKNFGDEISKQAPSEKALQKWLKKMSGAKHGSPLAYELLSKSRYEYAAMFLDRDAQIYGLREMMLSNDKGLALANGQIADQQLLKLTIEAGYYGEALEAYYTALSKHDDEVDAALRSAFGPTISQIRDIVDSDKAIARPISIGESGYVFLPLSKRVFGFDAVKGQFSTINLRCKRKFAQLEFASGSEYQIPEAWGACQMQIVGDPESSAQLIQL